MPFSLINGNFNVGGSPVANGSMVVTPSSSATIIATGGAAPSSYTFNLDTNGNLLAGAFVYGPQELSVGGVPGTVIYSYKIFSGANGTGSVVIGPNSLIVGPSAPYVGTLYPDVTVIPLISFSTSVIDGVTVSGTPTTGEVLMATSASAADWQFPLPATQTAPAHKFATAMDHSGNLTFTQPAFSDISGTVAASQLPNPSSSTLGGVESIAPVSHEFLTSISTSGVPSAAQPAFSDISGTVAASQLPNPTASTLGGVESIAPATHQFLTGISTSGVPSAAQPAFSDISGTVAASQLPNPSASTLGGVESFAAVSHQWINSISTSGVPSASQPAFSDLSGTLSVSQIGALAQSTADATAQSASISSTTMFTPTASGIWDISIYLVVTQAATSSSTLPAVSITWTDADNNTSQTITATSGNSGNSLGTVVQARITIHPKASTNVTYSAAGYASSGATAMQYALHIRGTNLG